MKTAITRRNLPSRPLTTVPKSFLGSLLFCLSLLASPVSAAEEEKPCFRIAIPAEAHVEARTVRRLVSELYAEAGLCVTLIDAPLPRSEIGLVTGAFDGEALRFSGYAIGHPKIVAVSTPLLNVEIYWAALNADSVPRTANLEALIADKRVAIPSQIIAFQNIARQFRLKPVTYEKPRQLLPLLESHRVQYALLFTGAFEALTNHDLARLDIRTFRSLPFQHVISRDMEWALPQLEAAAKRLHEAGRLRRLPEDATP
ncbi:hypothetical protein [Gimibacter soli]|uniref:Solute-binding protein family 3/N-terminal domain-containing protein n=1 Tax=Gimibacter soli TaxID=3024400 RepID=A0AAF0BI67_9PROT|nr:hypothetical protein [Gimibacter soli]WCL55018.1 hypothetical protein PH603_04500 [Gimibacter soli]